MRNFLAVIALVVAGTVTNLQFTQAPAKSGGATTNVAPVATSEPARPGDFPPFTADEALIATAPDPQLTRLALHFDRWIESLQRAAESSGYVFERQWIPWRTKQVEYNDPGLLLFRLGERRLAILLVGESPVSGISERQFATALRLASGSDHGLVGVVGPCFSGSYASLAKLLAGHQRVRVVTGSATSAAAIRQFKSQGFNPASTVDSDDVAMDAFQKYLASHNVSFRKSASLAEADTTYGKGESKESVHVTFPRDLSVLRGAYEADQKLRKTLLQTNDASSATTVSLSRSEDLNLGRDSVPTLSPVATAATQELAMEAVARRLREDHIGLASIFATNVLDIMFLRQYMGVHVPDMQFYVLEPDLLFVHSPEVNSFQGTLSVSRYPLFIRPDRRIVAFPSKASEGVYWAARSLLGSGFEGQSRQIWLSIVGLNGIYPVAPIFTDGKDGCLVDGCKPGAPPVNQAWEVRVTKAYFGVWLLVVGIMWLAVWASVEAHGARLNGQGPRRWCADFFFDPAAPLTFARRYHAYCLMLGIASIFLLISRPLQDVFGAPVYLPVIPTLISFWCTRPTQDQHCAGMLYPWFDARTTASDHRITRYLALLVTAGIAAFLVALYWIVWGEGNRDWAIFAAYRSMHFDCGVNPMLPLALLGLAILSCAWYHLQRFVFAAERFVPLDLSGCGTLSGPYERIRNILSRYATTPATIAALAVTWFVIGVAINYRSALTIEGHTYDLFLMTMLAATSGLTVLSVVQFLQTWWSLSDFLNGIEGLPIRHVFDRFPRDLGSVAIFNTGTRQRTYLYVIKGRDCLRLMTWMPEWIRHNVETSVDALLRRSGADERETGCETVEAQQALLLANGYLLYYLQHEIWWRGESELDPPKDRHAHVALAEEFIAFRILAFIRYSILQLRNLLTYFSVAFILQSLAISSYPFFSHSLAQLFIGAAFVVLAGASGYVLLRMSRDRTLQRLSADSKGKDHPVVLQFLHSASLPILAFASTYFPELGRVLFSWVEPALSSIK